MNQGQVVRCPDFIWAYAQREAVATGRRPNDVIGQLLRIGLETIEAGRAESLKAQKVIASLKAIA